MYSYMYRTVSCRLYVYKSTCRSSEVREDKCTWTVCVHVCNKHNHHHPHPRRPAFSINIFTYTYCLHEPRPHRRLRGSMVFIWLLAFGAAILPIRAAAKLSSSRPLKRRQTIHAIMRKSGNSSSSSSSSSSPFLRFTIFLSFKYKTWIISSKKGT